MRNPDVHSPPAAAKRRRHGYRGYGSPLARKGEGYGGAVHWGRGFAGVSIPALPSSPPEIPTAELLDQKYRNNS
jgi:hypothetical protein